MTNDASTELKSTGKHINRIQTSQDSLFWTIIFWKNASYLSIKYICTHMSLRQTIFVWDEISCFRHIYPQQNWLNQKNLNSFRRRLERELWHKLLSYNLVVMGSSHENSLLQCRIKLHIIDSFLRPHIDRKFVHRTAIF